MKTYLGWAIEKDFDWGKSLLGILYFEQGGSFTDLLACRTMVFRTREQAEAAKAGHLNGRGSRIVKVKVEIVAVKDERP